MSRLNRAFCMALSLLVVSRLLLDVSGHTRSALVPPATPTGSAISSPVADDADDLYPPSTLLDDTPNVVPMHGRASLGG